MQPKPKPEEDSMNNAESHSEQSRIISIDEDAVKSKLSEMIRGTVEEMTNAMFDAETEQLIRALLTPQFSTNRELPFLQQI